MSEVTIGVLGPEGSYTDLVADYLDYEKVYFNSINNVIKAVVNEDVSLGIIPIENSLEGTVIKSLDGIKSNQLFINKSLIMPIHHCVAGLNGNSNITSILSHPQALAQCSNYLRKHYPNAKLIETNSTSDAFRIISDEGLINSLAIGSVKSARIYGLKIIDKNIEDVSNNKTKFFVISKNKSINKESTKTLVVIYPTRNVQGVLYEMLGYFNDERINLSKIESRPSRKELGNYLFYIEFDGNLMSDKVNKALSNINKHIGPVTILGCYPEFEVK